MAVFWGPRRRGGRPERLHLPGVGAQRKQVCVFGDFNGWDDRRVSLEKVEGGIWQGFIPGLKRYDTYKYAIQGPDGKVVAKADPYAFHAETRPGNASKIYELDEYPWGDKNWLEYRAKNPRTAGP